jgi:hydrogenase small subunit
MLLAGQVPYLPQLILSHTAVSIESGEEYVENLRKCERGQHLPFVVVLEGSVPNEELSGDGYWVSVGEEKGRPVRTAEWLKRLCPKSAATIAIGTCATWGGIPAAYGNATGAMGLMDFLGKDFRSAFGLPVINIPGCAPIGDNFIETVSAILMFLQGFTPLPEFDELGRPAWLFRETVHRGCPRAGFYEEGVFAKEHGDKECLVEKGCWGPVVQCNMASRGAINGIGGCMQSGGVCIGCTMPGFPDKFAPFLAKPPGAEVSAFLARRVAGAITKPLRGITQRDKNRSIRWAADVPSGWAPAKGKSSLFDRFVNYFYKKVQKSR